MPGEHSSWGNLKQSFSFLSVFICSVFLLWVVLLLWVFCFVLGFFLAVYGFTCFRCDCEKDTFQSALLIEVLGLTMSMERNVSVIHEH